MREQDSVEMEHGRQEMLSRQLISRGIADPSVLAAMATVPREAFVPSTLARRAYEDHPLPIAAGQTISQPYIVALMAEAARIEPGDRVLEVGTGSGYGAAILAELAGEVWTIERHGELARAAAATLAELGYTKVHVIEGDGSVGYLEAAPYDAIVVTAGSPTVPSSLIAQLGEGGRLVIPVGTSSYDQELVRLVRDGDELHRDTLGAVRFVPLIGAEGRPE